MPGALCPACWGDTRFLTGHGCDACAAPLIGDGDGAGDLCDACLVTQRPWSQGRSAFVYSGAGRRIVLGLKRADRTDLVKPIARWMAQAGADLLVDDPVFIPVPIHWRRRVKRRYNQSAEIARALSALTGYGALPDALRRTRPTIVQDGLDSHARFANQSGSILLGRASAIDLSGRHVILIDDVMTSGATLTAAAEALGTGSVSRISVLTLARAVRNP